MENLRNNTMKDSYMAISKLENLIVCKYMKKHEVSYFPVGVDDCIFYILIWHYMRHWFDHWLENGYYCLMIIPIRNPIF